MRIIDRFLDWTFRHLSPYIFPVMAGGMILGAFCLLTAWANDVSNREVSLGSSLKEIYSSSGYPYKEVPLTYDERGVIVSYYMSDENDKEILVRIPPSNIFTDATAEKAYLGLYEIESKPSRKYVYEHLCLFVPTNSQYAAIASGAATKPRVLLVDRYKSNKRSGGWLALVGFSFLLISGLCYGLEKIFDKKRYHWTD